MDQSKNLVRKIDLTSLRLFVAVCQERSIARAAERECIAPSAVSRRVSEIEEIIGLPVMLRKSRGISLTPAGQTVLHHAEAVICSIESMGRDLSQYAAGSGGTVRIVANLSTIMNFLAKDIAAVKRLFPEIDIDLQEKDSIDVLRALDEQKAEIGICNVVPGIDNYERLPYRTDYLSLVVPKSHQMSNFGEVKFSEIVRETFIHSANAREIRQLLDAQSSCLDVRLHVKYQVNCWNALCRMVNVGLGVAVVPRHIGELYVSTLDIVLIPICEPWATRSIVVVFRSRNELTTLADSIVRCLTEQLGT